MKIFKKPEKLQEYIIKEKKTEKTIGLVPTMGALHHGHFSLVKKSVEQCDITITSIFVNPTQFSPNEDLDKYPKTLEQDKENLIKLGVDILFLPDNNTMYEHGFNTWVEVKGITEKLCGMSRPSHFRGVTTVVSKLFNICLPDIAYFGQKDYQQSVVIKRMARDLNFPVKIQVCGIIREEDGLAMSSRNKYLTDKQRKQALVLNKSLQKAQEMIKKGEKSVNKITNEIKSIIKTAPESDIDYIEIADADTLETVNLIENDIVIALAVNIGTTRLIDNALISGNES